MQIHADTHANGCAMVTEKKKAQVTELLNVGANANNGSQCGLAYANSNNAFSNSRTNIGARLKFLPNHFIPISQWLSWELYHTVDSRS